VLEAVTQLTPKLRGILSWPILQTHLDVRVVCVVVRRNASFVSSIRLSIASR